jgi:5-methylthioadenosine/S-adenosylhomocysteine deaminase
MPSVMIAGGTVVTMDERRVIGDGAIFVEGNVIRDLGPAAELAARYHPDKQINAAGKIVMPGLIDTHYHTCQQFLRGTLASITRQGQIHYPVWKNYLVPFESLLTPDDVHLSGLAAYANMIRVGTTCVSEHGARHPEQIAQAMVSTGIRGLLAESTMDIPDPDLPPNMIRSTEECLDSNLQIVRKWDGRGEAPIRGCFSLRQIIVCSPRLIKETCRLAEQHDALIQTHLAEGTYEVEYAINRYSLRPAEYLETLEALSPRLLCAHSVLLSDHEVELYAQYGVKMAHCPNGNYTGLGMAKFPLMRRLGVDRNTGIGSDGASGGSIDLFQAMNTSVIGQMLHFGTPYLDKTVTNNYQAVSMATINAARAVRWEDTIGSLTVGKQADIIILDPSSMDCQPVMDDVYYTIVKCLRGRDVETVLVNGKLVMEDRRLLTVDEDALRGEIKARVPALHAAITEYYDRQKGA